MFPQHGVQLKIPVHPVNVSRESGIKNEHKRLR